MSNSPCLLPLVIAVTGHRNIAQAHEATLFDLVQAQLKAIQARYPCTPLCMLSGLAEGADMICAQAA